MIGYHCCEICCPDYINNDETLIEISKEKGVFFKSIEGNNKGRS